MPTKISAIYRAEVQVPEEVYVRFGHTKEYELKSLEIHRKANVADSGQDAYAEIFEWAEDSSRKCVEAFAIEWEMYIRKLQRQMIDDVTAVLLGDEK